MLLTGVVIEGDRRGRELGFPTINLDGHELPTEIADGVYGGEVILGDARRLKAAISIGTRPTYYAATDLRLVEAFILDFNEDLYGEKVAILLGPYLRKQQSFSSEAELINQIQHDVEWIRAHESAPLPGSLGALEDDVIELHASSNGS